MRPFEYTTPNTIEQAVAALGRDTRALAGGTDLLTLMKADIAAPERLVNVKALLPRGIEARPAGLEIGALTTLAEIEAHATLRNGYRALGEAAALAATPQSRNLKAMDRKAWSFAAAGVACVLRLSGTKIAHVRIVLAGVAPIPWRAKGA